MCGLAVLAISALSDRLYFNEWVFPPFLWLHFNISQSLAVFYGRNPWHYYLSQGIPQLTTTSLPFLLLSLLKPTAGSPTSKNILAILHAAVYITVLTLSFISHKEVRFVYPLLPIFHVLAAPHVLSFFSAESSPSTSRSSARPTRPILKSRLILRHKTYLHAAIFVNVLLTTYLSLFHQSAPLDVLAFLRSEYAHQHSDLAFLSPANTVPTQGDDPLFAMFLTPCHSTPWRSHLLYPGLTARALTCEPPLHTQPGTSEREQYRDEADRFYDDPVAFLRRELWPTPFSLPRYIVGFEGVEPWLVEFVNETTIAGLSTVSLMRVWERWNGLFHDDWRRAGKMVVWKTLSNE